MTLMLIVETRFFHKHEKSSRNIIGDEAILNPKADLQDVTKAEQVKIARTNALAYEKKEVHAEQVKLKKLYIRTVHDRSCRVKHSRRCGSNDGKGKI